MNNVKNFDCEKQELTSLFNENLSLEVAGLGHTYVEFKLVAIEGNLLPLNQKIYMYFYRNDIYSKPRPNYRGSLIAFDRGGLQHGAEFFYQNDLKESDADIKLSIHEVIDDLYQNRRNG